MLKWELVQNLTKNFKKIHKYIKYIFFCNFYVKLEAYSAVFRGEVSSLSVWDVEPLGSRVAKMAGSVSSAL